MKAEISVLMPCVVSLTILQLLMLLTMFLAVNGKKKEIRLMPGHRYAHRLLLSILSSGSTSF